MNRAFPRVLLISGIVIHLASLLLPFMSYKCDMPQSFFSLSCSFSGLIYIVLPLFEAREMGFSFVVVCCWFIVVLAGLLTCVTNHMKRFGYVASMLVLPLFAIMLAAAPPDRWLGPIASSFGAGVLSLGGVLGVASIRTRRTGTS